MADDGRELSSASCIQEQQTFSRNTGCKGEVAKLTNIEHLLRRIAAGRLNGEGHKVRRLRGRVGRGFDSCRCRFDLRSKMVLFKINFARKILQCVQ
ncbi:hypothetical protein Xaut_2841 [Xanthobacter versatilis]|uniref:Uncharacterized protein n=1 Tax=Xanthobacter autotrophicus (strain ATCC BAA-1158 / Py2) TaxID=78245 RepID=A7IJ88_XANP2|nr:hypothetical protein Xaut_2841 [Xanthobacter autotrophicus Py2]